MKLIVGLGNPGKRYAGTYHNVGFDVVDELARRHGVRFESSPVEALVARIRGLGDGVLLAKPLSYMNVSGGPVGAVQRYFRIPLDELLVVVDDVNLPSGRLRLRGQGSAGGHNGLKSVIAALGTEEFARLRVGVGRGNPERDLADRVLARVPADERETLAAATQAAADAAEMFVTAPLVDVMNRFNPGPEPGGDDEPEEPGAARDSMAPSGNKSRADQA